MEGGSSGIRPLDSLSLSLWKVLPHEGWTLVLRKVKVDLSVKLMLKKKND